MSATADAILAHLLAVDAERARRFANPSLGANVLRIKEFQQRRFAHTYADMLRSTRYRTAARFFLDELYGPMDFTRRDSQFARVVPALARLFPRDVVETVAALAELHALSELLDTAMAMELDEPATSAIDYLNAWRRTGRKDERARQIALTLDVASRLDRLANNPLIRGSLRLMRGAARAAGLAELQGFLEAGLETFRAMDGAEEFSLLIASRERAFASALFAVRTNRNGSDIFLAAALAALPPDVIGGY